MKKRTHRIPTPPVTSSPRTLADVRGGAGLPATWTDGGKTGGDDWETRT